MRERRMEDLKLIGGRLSLDFVNTVDYHVPELRGEWLTSYHALVLWGRHAGLLAKGAADRLLAAARANPVGGEEALRGALHLREALYRLFMAAIEGKEASAEDLARLNAALSQALARLALVATPAGLVLDWPADDLPLERVLFPVARSAAEVLSSPADVSRLRHCAGEDCGWLFLDQSRNRSRRWCDMKDCGNRAKARRFYAQRRASREG